MLGLTSTKERDNMFSQKLEDYIVEVTNIVPAELCDQILKEYGADSQWCEAAIGTGVVDKTKRNVDTIPVSQPAVILENPLTRKAIDNSLFDCVSQAKDAYASFYPNCTVESDSGYDLLRYDEGMFYVEHVDSFKAQPRAISCSLALNDDYEGGEFSFFGRKIVIRPKKGSALLFPSNFMYPHEIQPVTKGTRYSIITWLI